jgi:hypothetical protein
MDLNSEYFPARRDFLGAGGDINVEGSSEG